MSTSTVVGNSDGPVTGLCPAPPPPPPPPPVPGQVPAMRINTVEPPTIRRPQIVNDGYEPPAAIQNAMLTKDKKPFTYTPGMGGKLDLSQIRSPRMARRVAKNANDEGIEGPPKSALEPKPTPPPNATANLFIQPQVAIPVFPTNIPVQTPANRTPPTPPANRTPPTPTANKTPTTPPANRIPSNVPEKQPEVVKPVTKIETKMTPLVTTSVQPGSPESPSTPTQVTLTKAPTPWLQNKNKPQEELPEWAKRPSMNKQSSSPESPVSPPAYTPPIQQQAQPPSPQWQPTQQRPVSQQPQYNQQPQMLAQQQQKRPYSSPQMSQQASPQANTQERVIPIRIEDRPSVFDVKREPGHHQFKQPSPHHQQRWGQQPSQNQAQNQVPKQPTTPQPAPSTGGGYIIPIMVEGSEKKPVGGPVANSSYSQPAMIVRNNVQSADNQTVKVIPQRGPIQTVQSDSGPVQSRSFRVLQKITDTDSTNDIDQEQLRKLQLVDDDRVLMNKFKEQVDNENTLHYEEDPRYRGSAIPSRMFRYLQTMTDSGDVPVVTSATPRQQTAINKRQNRNSKSFEEMQANLPPSEQQVPEPKKYMGSAIPSRSFKMLQAMTASESVGPDATDY
nr:extensin-like isoform X1 [Nomia melanderi]